MKTTKNDLALLIKKTVCRWCDYDGLKLEEIQGYPHPGGYNIEGEDHPQWLYIECPNCGYAFALWKLGVPSPERSNK